MKNLFKHSMVSLDNDRYLMWVIFIAPLINFLAGISIDMCSPSLPAMADYYNVSASVIKNTITTEMIGFSLGALIFGPLMDGVGRRVTIIMGLIVFIGVSAFAPFCTEITSVMVIRVIQGMMVAIVSIGSRVLVMDHFEGKRFAIAIMYTSIAYGSGPVIGPFIGGILQEYFGWKANFFGFAFFGAVILILFFMIIPETLKQPQSIALKHVARRYLLILTNKNFIAGSFILGGVSSIQMVFPTLGPFVIENVLHKTPITFGNSALFLGFSYLVGMFINRFLVHSYTQQKLIVIGFWVMSIGVVVQCAVALFLPLTLFTLILPSFIICGSTGLIFANVMGLCLRLFPNSVGTASAVQLSLLVVIGSLGVFIISHFNVSSLKGFSLAYGVAVLFQLAVYFLFFRNSLVVEHSQA